MPNVSRCSSMLTTKKLLILYAFSSFVALLYLMIWCSADKDRSRRIYEAQIERDRESLHESKLSLRKLEIELRKKYPQESRSIQEKAATELPWIYAITPTYKRLVQKAELTRLSQTLVHLPKFHWIVVEDAEETSALVADLLASSGIVFTHLHATTPPDYKLETNQPNWFKPRGVLQRNRGLAWLRANRFPWRDDGVVYFLDDDNTYDLRLFEEMRSVDRVGVWPVGLVGALLYEAPIVGVDGGVVGWHSGWKPEERPFAMDMAGFAVRLKLIFLFPDAVFGLRVKRGYQEGSLLAKMNVSLADLEPKANNCTEVLVWHTRTEKPEMKMERKYQRLGKGSRMDVVV